MPLWSFDAGLFVVVRISFSFCGLGCGRFWARILVALERKQFYSFRCVYGVCMWMLAIYTFASFGLIFFSCLALFHFFTLHWICTAFRFAFAFHFFLICIWQFLYFHSLNHFGEVRVWVHAGVLDAFLRHPRLVVVSLHVLCISVCGCWAHMHKYSYYISMYSNFQRIPRKRSQSSRAAQLQRNSKLLLSICMGNICLLGEFMCVCVRFGSVEQMWLCVSDLIRFYDFPPLNGIKPKSFFPCCSFIFFMDIIRLGASQCNEDRPQSIPIRSLPNSSIIYSCSV